MTVRGRYSPTEDHGEIDGLGDNDHPQYLLAVDYNAEDGTAQGQVLFWDVAQSKWVHTEVTEIFWDDTGKGLTLAELLVNGKVKFTQVDGNEYIDSLADGYLDSEATTGIRFRIDGTEQVNLVDGKLASTTDNDVQLGDATHRFKKGYFVDLRDTFLSPNRLIKASASTDLRSADLDDFVTGTANQIIVTDNGDGTATLSLPQDFDTGATPTLAGLILSGLTLGSVVFIGVDGVLSEDNSKFFWDNTNKRLGVKNAAPTSEVDVSGTVTMTRLLAGGITE